MGSQTYTHEAEPSSAADVASRSDVRKQQFLKTGWAPGGARWRTDAASLRPSHACAYEYTAAWHENQTWGVFDCTANFGSSLHPLQTASTADSSCNRTALPQVLPETRDVISRQNKTDAGFREVRRVFAFQSEFCRVLTRVLCLD